MERVDKEKLTIHGLSERKPKLPTMTLGDTIVGKTWNLGLLR